LFYELPNLNVFPPPYRGAERVWSCLTWKSSKRKSVAGHLQFAEIDAEARQRAARPQAMQRAFKGPLRDLTPAPAAAVGASQALGNVEREALLDTLRRACGNKKRTAARHPPPDALREAQALRHCAVMTESRVNGERLSSPGG
jgi:hypothetical protein